MKDDPAVVAPLPEIPAELSDLTGRAKKTGSSAYAKYSGFRVGAAVRCASGEIYLGCNVDNVAYPLGICAEASAIVFAVRRLRSSFL